MAEPVVGRARSHARVSNSSVVDVVESNRRAVDAIVARGEGRELLALLRAADAELRRRMVVAHARGLAVRWTGVQIAATRTMVVDAIRAVQHGMMDLLTRDGGRLVARGIRDVVAVLRHQERGFGGVVKPLAMEQALRFDHVLVGVHASRLRQMSSSITRYGTRMISEFERVMRVGVVTRSSVGEVVDALAAHGGPGGLFHQRRYFAERIVRTELLASYNHGAQATMVEELEDFPDLQRIILAHHDRRTAPDSIFVHGEIRGLSEDFVDGAGRHYRVPPARPNDRECVVPWRRAWTMPAEFRPAPPNVRAEARAAAHDLRPPARRVAASS